MINTVFMVSVSAIEQAAKEAEYRMRLIVDAKLVRQEMITTGKGLDGDEVHAFLKAKVLESKTAKPKVRLWRV